jgi:hypothetical protein
MAARLGASSKIVRSAVGEMKALWLRLPTQKFPPNPSAETTPQGYKLEVLSKAEVCTEPGQIGALLHREGLYLNGPPQPPSLPPEVWIHPPEQKTTREIAPGGTFSTLVDPKGPPGFNTYGDSAEVDVAPARVVTRGSTCK